MKNIVLVGFMGTGKTETAKVLAQRKGMSYFSMDDEIEKRTGMKISDIFQQKGEAHFRQLEAELSKELGLKSGLVIDAGGGVVINPDNVSNLKQNGVIVCLTSTAERILERTQNFGHRPLLNVDNPLTAIKELMGKREEFYSLAADYTVDCNDLTVDEAASEIQELLKDVE